MGATQVRSEQIGTGEVKRSDLNVTTSGSAVVAKLVAGTGISLSSTGPDAGTGDVTINATGGGSSPLTTKGDLFGFDTAGARVPVGTDGQMLVSDSADTQGLSWKNQPYDLAGFRQAGTSPLERWYLGGLMANTATLSTTSLTANTIRAMPFIVPRECTLDRIGMEVTTQAAGTNTRLGIYASSSGSNLYPGALVLDAGTISNTGTGMKTITISQLLTAGLYWLVFTSDGAPAMRSLVATQCLPILGCPAGLGSTVISNAIGANFTYAVLPDPFPSGATVLNISLATIAVRLA